MAKIKTEEQQVNADQSITLLNDILKEKDNRKEHFNFEKTVDWKISTGSILIDSAIDGGLKPCLVRLCGENNSGKTPQALEIMRNFLQSVPNAKGFWMIAEGRGLSKENKERCGITFVTNPDDWKPGTVFVLESNIFELFIECVKKLVLDNPQDYRYAFVVDSVDGLQLRSDAKKDITDDNKVAGVPALSKKMFQSLSLGMFKYGHLMVLISQVTAEIKLDKYVKTPNRGGNFSGGNALLHNSDFIFEFQKINNGDYILDNPSGRLNDGATKPVGRWTRVMLAKSIVEKSSHQLIQYPIKFGRKPSGIWLEKELCDMLIALELLKAGGAWLTLDESLANEIKNAGFNDIETKFQGVDKVCGYFEKNSKLVEFLIPKIIKFHDLIKEDNQL